MSNIIRRHKFLTIIIVILLIAAVAAASFVMYRKNQVNILDTDAFNEFAENIEAREESGGFADQASLRDFITSWADENGIEYKTDKYDNIIFITKAVERKKNVSPTAVCVSYNYETAIDNSRLLASAAMIAATPVESGRKTVIFFNDEKNEGTGYKHVSKKLLGGKSKVIYLDYGASSYISTSSFVRTLSRVTVPAKKEPVTCDTVVRIHITGIKSDEISTGLSKHPDLVSVFSNILTRLKSKSTTFQLADFSMGSNGQMYPVSLDATFVLNSYSVSSFTKYIDKRIKAMEKSFADDYPDLSFTYEVIDDPAAFPESAYTASATSKLNNVLFTLKSGGYKYESGDTIPEGREEGDVFGINYMTGLAAADDSITIDILSQAYDSTYLDRIITDNSTAASLFKCKYATVDTFDRFINDKNSLSLTLVKTFHKVSDIIGANSVLTEESDNYFTPCSYLAARAKSADIVHLRLSSRRARSLTNAILCYIETKGNLFSL